MTALLIFLEICVVASADDLLATPAVPAGVKVVEEMLIDQAIKLAAAGRNVNVAPKTADGYARFDAALAKLQRTEATLRERLRNAHQPHEHPHFFSQQRVDGAKSVDGAVLGPGLASHAWVAACALLLGVIGIALLCKGRWLSAGNPPTTPSSARGLTVEAGESDGCAPGAVSGTASGAASGTAGGAMGSATGGGTFTSAKFRSPSSRSRRLGTNADA